MLQFKNSYKLKLTETNAYKANLSYNNFRNC